MECIKLAYDGSRIKRVFLVIAMEVHKTLLHSLNIIHNFQCIKIFQYPFLLLLVV
jgi:hypothetical protein